MKEFTETQLNKFFEDNFIEDSELYNFLKGRIGTISENLEVFSDGWEDGQLILDIKLKLVEL